MAWNGWGIARFLVLATVCLAGVAAFTAVSATINGQPSMRPFPGWIAVLQRGDVSDNQVLLSATAELPGGRGDHPAVTYSVAVCGRSPFQGVLLVGGDARLAPIPGVRMVTGPTRRSPASLRHISRLTFESVSFGSALELGEVQSVGIQIDHPSRCVGSFVIPVSEPPQFSGVALTVTGRARSPVQRAWMGPASWWSGPRTSQVWPMIGTFPGAGPQELGEFRGLEGLSGGWSRPRLEYASVFVGSLTERAAIEFARPTPSELTSLRWDGLPGLRPAARLVNSDQLAVWQQRLVLATILLSVGASVLAGLLMAGFGPRGSSAPKPRRPTPEPQAGEQPSPESVSARAVACGLLLLLLARRWRRD